MGERDREGRAGREGERVTGGGLQHGGVREREREKGRERGQRVPTGRGKGEEDE